MTNSERAQVTGRFAGPVTRTAGFAVDWALVVGLYGLITSITVYLFELLVGREVNTEDTWSGWWLLLFLSWSLTYFWTSLAISGRTVGKWLVGVRVVQRDGTPLRPRPAFVRVVAQPLSFLFFGLGYIGLLIGDERRALHDVIAGSVVVYDFGDRPAEMPAPLTRWLERQDVIEPPIASDQVTGGSAD